MSRTALNILADAFYIARDNAVSPPWVRESLVKLGMDPSIGLATPAIAKAGVTGVEGSHQGSALDARRLHK